MNEQQTKAAGLAAAARCSTPSESAVRRKARRRLYKLTKYGERSRWGDQYGPYSLANEYNTLTHWGLTLADANEILDGIDTYKPSRRG